MTRRQSSAATRSSSPRASVRSCAPRRGLARVLIELQLAEASAWQRRDTAFATLFSLAAVRWGVTAAPTLSGYAWAWCENQVLAAVKLVPLGQSAGQRLLHRLTDSLPAVVAGALELPDDAIGTSALSQVLAASLHEAQYSRLFRS
jgi:urease accessory protein